MVNLKHGLRIDYSGKNYGKMFPFIAYVQIILSLTRCVITHCTVLLNNLKLYRQYSVECREFSYYNNTTQYGRSFKETLLLYDRFFDVFIVTLVTYLPFYVQASLFDSSQKREGSEVDLSKSKLQETGEAWRCACQLNQSLRQLITSQNVSPCFLLADGLAYMFPGRYNFD